MQKYPPAQHANTNTFLLPMAEVQKRPSFCIAKKYLPPNPWLSNTAIYEMQFRGGSFLHSANFQFLQSVEAQYRKHQSGLTAICCRIDEILWRIMQFSFYGKRDSNFQPYPGSIEIYLLHEHSCSENVRSALKKFSRM